MNECSEYGYSGGFKNNDVVKDSITHQVKQRPNTVRQDRLSDYKLKEEELILLINNINYFRHDADNYVEHKFLKLNFFKIYHYYIIKNRNTK